VLGDGFCCGSVLRDTVRWGRGNARAGSGRVGSLSLGTSNLYVLKGVERLGVVETRSSRLGASSVEEKNADDAVKVGQCPGGARKSTKGVAALLIERLQGGVRKTG